MMEYSGKSENNNNTIGLIPLHSGPTATAAAPIGHRYQAPPAGPSPFLSVPLAPIPELPNGDCGPEFGWLQWDSDTELCDVGTQTSCTCAAVAADPEATSSNNNVDGIIQTSTSSYESAIISEAHGLISDMLADSSLPPHVVSGLRAVSNLLKPPDAAGHNPMHKPKVSPLVSLTEAANYGSDSDDLPYTGERPSSLPKRLRRSLPPSLIRRMSTSTWTTTTSATGMPTLETEPCRTRSSSFRHSRDNTPGSSPTGSRSNSPSPSSPTTISLTIPKSRSFSVTAVGLSNSQNNQKRSPRERRSLGFAPTFSASNIDSLSGTRGGLDKLKADLVSEGADNDGMTVVEGVGGHGGGGTGKDVLHPVPKHLNITSDYESNDSPSSSDHSDNVTTMDESSKVTSRVAMTATTTLASDARGIEEKIKTGNQSGWGGPHGVVNKDSLPSASPGGDTCLSSSRTRDSNAKDVCERRVSLGTPVLAVTSSGSKEDPDRADPSSAEENLPYCLDDIHNNEHLNIKNLNQWDYQIFDLAVHAQDCILSMVSYKLFAETGLLDTFRIPVPEFITYFHALELGYREKPYHNRIHATDVLHGVYYLTTQPIPGFTHVNPEGDIFQKAAASSSESDSEGGERPGCATCHTNFTAEDSYGIMAGNLPPLELMALYTAAAMHDYDHPGRTNAFLVATHDPLAILYNDRSVLESHHAASAWQLCISEPRFNWLVHLDKAEFKRFRFLVIEAILATDLKRHFELCAEYNAKANADDAPGIDWTSESDRLMVTNMVIKMADINGPAKRRDLHYSWTHRISEEFYEQGDEEDSRGLAISPYMDRKHPQLAKLQESFINHLVAPLCNCLGASGLLPGTWVDIDSEGMSESDKGDSTCKDTEDEELEIASANHSKRKRRGKKIHCWLTKNLKDNHDIWVGVLKKEIAQKEQEQQELERKPEKDTLEMEPITEEDTPPNSANSLKDTSGESRHMQFLPQSGSTLSCSKGHQNSSTGTSAFVLPPQSAVTKSAEQSQTVSKDMSQSVDSPGCQSVSLEKEGGSSTRSRQSSV